MAVVSKKIVITVVVIAVVVVVGLVSIFSSRALKESSSRIEETSVRVVYAAHTQAYVPYDFVNDKGESDGFEVAVLRAVDELLDDYEIKFVPTSDDDIFIGVESGKYAVGTKGVWMTEERKKKFLFPQHYIAASIIGITFRSADADKITDLSSFARYSGKLVPIAPQSAQFAVVQDFNEKNPSTPITLVPSDVFIINDAYSWVLEGRYDAFFDIKLSYLNNVVSESGPYHSLAGKLAYAPYKGIPTWPLFNKNEVEFAAAYDTAIEILRSNGTITALSNTYFGEDVFQYISE